MKKKIGRGILLLPAGAKPAPPAVDEIESMSMAMLAFVATTMATATTTMKDELLMMVTCGGYGGDGVDSDDDNYHGDIDDDGVASCGFGGGGMSPWLTWRGWSD